MKIIVGGSPSCQRGQALSTVSGNLGAFNGLKKSLHPASILNIMGF